MDEKKEGEKSSWEEEAEANGLEWGEGRERRQARR